MTPGAPAPDRPCQNASMAELALRVESTPSPAPLRGFPWYVAGVAAWFGGFGMQQVLFSWLVVGELAAEARWVGVAQSASMVPNFLLLLLGWYFGFLEPHGLGA